MSLNLNGTEFKVGFSHGVPFVRIHLSENAITGKRRWVIDGGCDGQFILTMADKMNFTLNLLDMKRQYGSKHVIHHSNGTFSTIWDGIVGMAANETIDIGLGSWGITYERSQVVKYLYPYLIGNMGFITPQEDRNISSSDLFTPFDIWIWLLLFLSFSMIYSFNFLRNMIIPKRELYRYKDFIWIQIQLLFRQNQRAVRNFGQSSRMTTIVWLMATMILTNCYAGMLRSVITYYHPNTIDTLEELADASEDGRMTVMVINGTSMVDTIVKSESTLMQRIAKKLVIINNKQEAVSLLLQYKRNTMQNPEIAKYLPSYALMLSMTLSRSLQIIHGKHNIHVADSDEASFNMGMLSWAFRPSFQYVRSFNRLSSLIVESGLYRHWLQEEFIIMDRCNYQMEYSNDQEKHRHQQQQNRNTIEDYEQIKPFTIGQLMTPFKYYACGIFISFLFFFIENVYFSLKKNLLQPILVVIN